jgi:hypothetical protein
MLSLPSSGISSSNHRSPMFYCLDGDEIGSIIDGHLIRCEIDAASHFSNLLTSTLEEIREIVIEKGIEVKYCAGDNIMMYGCFNSECCQTLIDLFHKRVGRTASMGIGCTAANCWFALQFAKTCGGGKVIYYDGFFQMEKIQC